MGWSENASILGKTKLSYSKLKIADKCGYQFNKRYIERAKKTDKVESSSSSIVGTFIHSVIELVLEHFYIDKSLQINRGTVKPIVLESMDKCLIQKPLTNDEAESVHSLSSSVEYMCRRILTYAREHDSMMLFEEKIALDENFSPVEYGSDKVFIQGLLDLVLIDRNGNILIVDHKTGYPNARGYEPQMKVYNILAFHGLNEKIKSHTDGKVARSVKSGLNFIEPEELSWLDGYTIQEMESQLVPWFIQWVEACSDGAAESVIQRGNHCKHCSYKTLCGSRVGKMKPRKKKVSTGINI